MDLKKNELDLLRGRLRKSYLFLHRNDEKRHYISDQTKSKENSFLKALRKDINNIFGDASTPSIDIVLSLFFDTNKINYSEKSINRFKNFCEEIEERQNIKSKTRLLNVIKWFKSKKGVIISLLVASTIVLFFTITLFNNSKKKNPSIEELEKSQQVLEDSLKKAKDTNSRLENDSIKVSPKNEMNVKIINQDNGSINEINNINNAEKVNL